MNQFCNCNFKENYVCPNCEWKKNSQSRIDFQTPFFGQQLQRDNFNFPYGLQQNYQNAINDYTFNFPYQIKQPQPVFETNYQFGLRNYMRQDNYQNAQLFPQQQIPFSFEQSKSQPQSRKHSPLKEENLQRPPPLEQISQNIPIMIKQNIHYNQINPKDLKNQQNHRASFSNQQLFREINLIIQIELGESGRTFDKKINLNVIENTMFSEIKKLILNQINQQIIILKENQEQNYYNFSYGLFQGKKIDDSKPLMVLPLSTLSLQIIFVLADCKFNLTKEGYLCIPSQNELLQMDDNQLSKVQDFTIWSENGQVIWEGCTDLRFVNLDEVLQISILDVGLYENINQIRIPYWGQKLNKKCTLFGTVNLNQIFNIIGTDSIDAVNIYLTSIPQISWSFDKTNFSISFSRNYYAFT